MINKRLLTIYIIRSAVVLLIALIVTVAVIYLFRIRITKIETSLRENQQLIRSLELREQTIANLRKQFETIKEDDARIASAFPFSDDVLQSIATIENVAHQNGVTTAKQFGTPTAYATLQNGVKISSIPFTLSAQGSIQSITKFLAGIEALPYFVSIQSISIQSPTNGDWSQVSNTSMSGVLYTRERP